MPGAPPAGLAAVPAALTAAVAFLGASLGCVVLRRLAERRALLDLPNERSLHGVPVPRLGGAGLVLGAGLALACGLPALTPDVIVWLAATGLVAALGLVDDLRPLSAALRFPLQLALAAAFVLGLGTSGPLVLLPGVAVTLPAGAQLALGVLLLVAVLNLYNFMDGMDGLAGSQGVVAGAALALACVGAGHADLALVALALAAASAGFLVHNAPPATIFMGDAGSTCLGFGLAALGLAAAARTPPVPLATPLLALSPFLLDGTFTLVRRATRLEPVWRAHRSHLYQRAVQAGRGHREVLIVYTAWMAASGAGAVVTASAAWPTGLIVTGASLAALLGVHAWVRALERARPPA